MVTERLGQTDRVEAALAEMDEQLRNTGVAPAGRPVAFQEGPADDSRARVRTGGRRELAGPGSCDARVSVAPIEHWSLPLLGASGIRTADNARYGIDGTGLARVLVP